MPGQPLNGTNQDTNQGGTKSQTKGLWDFLGDLVGASAVVVGNIFKPRESQTVYVPQTPGLSSQTLTIMVVAMIILVAVVIFKGRKR